MSSNHNKTNLLKHKVPIKGKRNILITSALPYVNATPHLGNLIGCVLSADVFSRYTKLRGYNSVYICGNDEYGTATEFKAMEENCSPQEVCDKYHEKHKQIYDWFDIEFDHFGRTSTDIQTKITTEIFRKLDENGFIEEKLVLQHYCGSCEKYLADRFIEGVCPVCKLPEARGDQCDSCGEIYESTALVQARCKKCHAPTELRETNHLFLRLSKLAPKLKTWVNECARDGGWTANSVSVSRAWLKKLENRCISRSLKWGTPIPKAGFQDKVFYVWFDAPIGYISITAGAIADWELWWKSKDVELFQFLGKDNITFHTLIFPGTLLGTGEQYTLARNISTTEYLTFQGGKFSKSKRRGVFGDDAQSTGIPSEVWRYYLLANRPETTDSDFDWKDLMLKANSELNNNLGNFVHRTSSFIFSRFGALVPVLGVLDKTDTVFVETISQTYQKYLKQMEGIKIKASVRSAMKLCDEANAYYQTKKAWETVSSNSEADRQSCQNCLSLCFQVLRLLSAVFSPFIPSVSLKINATISCDPYPLTEETFKTSAAFDNHRINQPEILFRKITEAEINALKVKFDGGSKSFPLDLVVGTIDSVKDHPSSPNLSIISVFVGGKNTKNVVCDLGDCVVEDILNKNVILVCNVKKKKIGGVNTNALILSTKTAENKKRLVFTGCQTGSRILPMSKSTPVEIQKNFNATKSWPALNISVTRDSKLAFSGEMLSVDGKEVVVNEVADKALECF